MPEAAVEGKLRRVRRDGASDGAAAMRLPPGYSLEAGDPGRLVLRRSDGTVVAAFAFSAFGPTPEAIHEAAEEDRLRRRAAGDWEEGEEGRGG